MGFVFFLLIFKLYQVNVKPLNSIQQHSTASDRRDPIVLFDMEIGYQIWGTEIGTAPSSSRSCLQRCLWILNLLSDVIVDGSLEGPGLSMRLVSFGFSKPAHQQAAPWPRTT